MTVIPEFIARLVRAANEADRLSAEEVRRLLSRAVVMINELRQQVGIVPIKERDALIYLRTVLAGADRVPREEWHHSLLHAAEMIRDLRIVLDTDTHINLAAPA